jgi:hypothetical protein
MFQSNWPSSDVRVVMVKDSAVHCNVAFFPPIVVAFGYFGCVGYHQFYLGVHGLHIFPFGFVWFVVAALNVLAGGRNLYTCRWPLRQKQVVSNKRI